MHLSSYRLLDLSLDVDNGNFGTQAARPEIKAATSGQSNSIGQSAALAVSAWTGSAVVKARCQATAGSVQLRYRTSFRQEQLSPGVVSANATSITINAHSSGVADFPRCGNHPSSDSSGRLVLIRYRSPTQSAIQFTGCVFNVNYSTMAGFGRGRRRMKEQRAHQERSASLHIAAIGCRRSQCFGDLRCSESSQPVCSWNQPESPVILAAVVEMDSGPLSCPPAQMSGVGHATSPPFSSRVHILAPPVWRRHKSSGPGARVRASLRQASCQTEWREPAKRDRARPDAECQPRMRGYRGRVDRTRRNHESAIVSRNPRSQFGDRLHARNNSWAMATLAPYHRP
jgi:hypothetical protein